MRITFQRAMIARGAIAFALMSPAFAATPSSPEKAAVTAPAGPLTLQQQFDSAVTDVLDGRCDAAISKFEALEKNPKIKPGSVPATTIAVRKGTCQVKLKRNNFDEGAFTSAISILSGAGAEFSMIAAEGWVALGSYAVANYDYAQAKAHYLNALAALDGNAKLNVLALLAKATAFDGTDESLSYADEGLKILSANPAAEKTAVATFHTIKGRTLLNKGRAKEGLEELKKALKLEGGLTLKTEIAEVALRNDLATAAMLLGKDQDARNYLVYTGAGRLPKEAFSSASYMEAPLCGEESGLRPDDMAVVEFSIDDDGTVASAQTVYTRGDADVAAAFGRAAKAWYWDKADIAKIPAFYRLLVRMEMRCSMSLGSGPGILQPLNSRFDDWMTGELTALGITKPEDGEEAATAQTLLKSGKEGGNLHKQLLGLGLIISSNKTSRDDKNAAIEQAMQLTANAPSGTVPNEVLSWLEVMKINGQASKEWGKGETALAKAKLALADTPHIAADPIASATLILDAARTRRVGKSIDKAALFSRVANDARLPENHPLKQVALLELAGLAVKKKDMAAAEAAFAQTGLNAEQCSALGVPPQMRLSNVDSSDFPMEAFGFGGWIQTEFDIQTNGRTLNPRTIIAYPPMIFADAGKKMASNFIYDVSFRPGATLACSSNREKVKFATGN